MALSEDSCRGQIETSGKLAAVIVTGFPVAIGFVEMIAKEEGGLELIGLGTILGLITLGITQLPGMVYDRYFSKNYDGNK